MLAERNHYQKSTGGARCALRPKKRPLAASQTVAEPPYAWNVPENAPAKGKTAAPLVDAPHGRSEAVGAQPQQQDANVASVDFNQGDVAQHNADFRAITQGFSVPAKRSRTLPLADNDGTCMESRRSEQSSLNFASGKQYASAVAPDASTLQTEVAVAGGRVQSRDRNASDGVWAAFRVPDTNAHRPRKRDDSNCRDQSVPTESRRCPVDSLKLASDEKLTRGEQKAHPTSEEVGPLHGQLQKPMLNAEHATPAESAAKVSVPKAAAAGNNAAVTMHAHADAGGNACTVAHASEAKRMPTPMHALAPVPTPRQASVMPPTSACAAARELVATLLAPLAVAIDAACDDEPPDLRTVRAAMRAQRVPAPLLTLLAPAVLAEMLRGKDFTASLFDILLGSNGDSAPESGDGRSASVTAKSALRENALIELGDAISTDGKPNEAILLSAGRAVKNCEGGNGKEEHCAPIKHAELCGADLVAYASRSDLGGENAREVRRLGSASTERSRRGATGIPGAAAGAAAEAAEMAAGVCRDGVAAMNGPELSRCEAQVEKMERAKEVEKDVEGLKRAEEDEGEEGRLAEGKEVGAGCVRSRPVAWVIGDDSDDGDGDDGDQFGGEVQEATAPRQAPVAWVI